VNDAGGNFTALDLQQLADFLIRLHELPVNLHEVELFQNRQMRTLNHQHIFEIPLQENNGLDTRLDGLTPGLSNLAADLKKDSEYVAAVHRLGEKYLRPTRTNLLHGDFFPGSLLQMPDRRWVVIDPEFCFVGDAEFDVGVFLAHLHLSGHSESLARQWISFFPLCDPVLIGQYAGVEIMRRILGVAQLPITSELSHKRDLLELSKNYLSKKLT
jgi:5-methylthioribose kinase